MNVLVPLNEPTALPDYLSAGAGEFYLGFADDEWTRRFGPEADLNRLSGFGGQANACTFPEALDAIAAIVVAGARAYVPFNTAIYTAAQRDYIAHAYFPALAAAGADGVILSGPELMSSARHVGLLPVASTMCGIFNADTARFFRRRGAGRLILPRELSLAEIRFIMEAVPDVEYEVFLMRNGCVFSDSHCLGCHRAGRYSLCRDLRFSAQWAETCGQEPTPIDEEHLGPEGAWDQLFARAACGLCALWDLHRLGVNAGKIVGRCDETADIVRDISLARFNMEVASLCDSVDEYHARMHRPQGAEQICTSGLNCYYPEAKAPSTARQQTVKKM